MKNKFVKTIILSSILTLIIGTFQIPFVSANNENVNLNKVYEQEIERSIISGDGSAEHPYVLNTETAPKFTEYMERNGQKALNLIQENSGISTYGVMDGVLSGKSHANQTNGGYWVYKSGAPSAIYNGNIWMKSVEYVSKEDTKNIFASLSVSSTRNKFFEALSSVLGSKTLSSAASKLAAKGFSNAVATSLCKWLGFGGSALAGYLLVSDINDWVKKAPYEAAYKAGKGLISCYYLTSYQGKWYSHSLSETWSTCPTAKEPGTFYGTGTYTSRK